MADHPKRPTLCPLCLRAERELLCAPQVVDLTPEPEEDRNRRPDRDRSFVHQLSYTALVASANEGCDLCLLIKYALIDAHTQSVLPVGVPLDDIEAHLYEQETRFPDFAFLKVMMEEHVLGEGCSPVSTGYCNVEFHCPGSAMGEYAAWSLRCPLKITLMLTVEAGGTPAFIFPAPSLRELTVHY
jgi:hypothetical protein